MTFEEVVDQAIDMVRRRGQVSYRMLKRQFDIDDTYLDDLKYELIEIQQLAVDQDGKVLVWTGEVSTPPSSQPTQQPFVPLSLSCQNQWAKAARVSSSIQRRIDREHHGERTLQVR